MPHPDPFADAIARRVAPGVQLAAWMGGRELAREAGRIAYAPDAAAITAATRFDIASVGKVVTGLLALTLDAEGVLPLDRRIADILPECRLAGPTLRHLLTHTSGWDVQGLPPNRPRHAERDAYLRTLLAHGATRAAPGAELVYCTHGYSLVMLAIERATGIPYATFAHQRLFAPLGMAATTYDEASLGHPGFAIPLRRDDDAPETWAAEVGIIGDGYLRTTARELLRVGRVLLDRGAWGGRQLIPERAAAAAFADATGGRFSHSGAMFLNAGPRVGSFAPAHRPGAGFHPGFFGCCLAVDPALGVSWVALSPSERLHDPPAWGWVGQAIVTGEAGLHPVG